MLVLGKLIRIQSFNIDSDSADRLRVLLECFVPRALGSDSGGDSLVRVSVVLRHADRLVGALKFGLS